MNKQTLQIGNLLKRYAILMVLMALIVFFTALNPVFLSVSNLVNIVRQISYLGIGCVGGMCCMLTGGVDLSLGKAITMNNILISWLMVNQ